MSSILKHWSEVLMNTYGTPPLALVSGEGAIVRDDSDKEYIDLLAGIAVNSLGHGHPAVVEAVSKQVASLAHVSNLFASEPVVTVASALRERFQGGEETRVFFCNSGAEANEAAFKLARLTGKTRVLTAINGFHGRTMGSLSLTGQPDKRQAFEPLVPGVEYFRYNDIDSLTDLVEQDPGDTAAIMLEPIQGETGVIPADKEFIRAVKELCDRYGILLIFDEVQTGVGRTGSFFAHEQYGVKPDVLTMAKGLGAGLPIGACLATGNAAKLFGPGSHGTTFGGNPVACAAAKAVLSTIDEAFLAQVRARGKQFHDGLANHPAVDHVRGEGLMLGIVLKKPLAKQAVQAGFAHRLILNAPGQNVLRLTPPLIISKDQVDEAVNRLRATLEDISGKEEE